MSTDQTNTDQANVESRDTHGSLQWALAGIGVVLVLGALVRWLEQTVPAATEDTAIGGIAGAIEYPVYAIVLGLLGNALLIRLGLRDRLAGGFRTEFFIKTGLVLLGASINIAVIVSAAGPAVPQALILISVSASPGGSVAGSGWTTSCVRCWPPPCPSAG